jgi:hypothetical protein
MLKSMLTTAAAKANLMDGVRAASASAIMLLVGCALHAPDFSWAAIGAFWTSLATAPQPRAAGWRRCCRLPCCRRWAAA